MSLLTKSQLAALRKDIRLRHAALLVQTLGDRAVTADLLKAIKKAGLYPKKKADALRKAFGLGRVTIEAPQVRDASPSEVTAYLRDHPMVVTPEAQERVQRIQRSYTQYVGKLSQDLTQRVTTALRKADAAFAASPGDAGARAEAVKSFKAELAEATRQQLADAHRTLNTHVNNAYQEGRAHQIIIKSGNPDPEVFKRVRPDACSDCKDAYLEADEKTPRIFRLSTLVANGSNIGKSREDRRAVVDAYHPHCHCELHYLGAGFSFDAQGRQVYVGQGLKKAGHG